MRQRWLMFVAVTALVASACGGDSGDAETTTAATDAATTSQATTTTTEAETTTTAGPETTATTEAETTTTTEAAGPLNVNANLSEWMIELSAPLTAGTITFDITNNGEFNHEFIVLRATSYDDLPKTANGAVDEGALAPDAVVDRVFALETGQTNSLTVDLEAGDYVLLCNISVGPNSHAANGQVLSVTVGP